jgi:hypothetical protein
MGQDLDETVIDLVLVGCRLSPLGFDAPMPDPLGVPASTPEQKRPAVTVIDVCIIRTARSGHDAHVVRWDYLPLGDPR